MNPSQNTSKEPTDVYFRKTTAFDPLTDIGPQVPIQLRQLISTYPSLKVYTPSSPLFTDLKSIWNLQYSKNKPLALIRATNSEEVSIVVKFCATHYLPLAVRSGGHDLWGRSIVADTVILDIRELNQITLAEDKESVTIGGGVQTGPLVDFLDSHGLVTPCSLAGIVGHVGWAFSGGFGPLVNAYGLGVDQILSVKIITADGKVQEADGELLWGIKGAGGAFGVVIEVKIKTYSLPIMLGGLVLFQFDQATEIIANLLEMINKGRIPSHLGLGFHFSKREGRVVFGMAFSWASINLEQGREWLAQIKALGTVVMDMVSETTIKKWSDMMAPMLPQPSHNTSRSVLLASLNPTAVNILSSFAESIPDGLQFGLGNFIIFGEATKPRPDSCFQIREPYVFLHALGPVAEESRLKESQIWTNGVLEKLQDAGLIKANYLALMSPDLSVEKCFGKVNFDRLKALKKEVDPENLFQHVPASFL